MHHSSPLIAALHPVNALLIFWLGIVVARDASAALAAPGETPAVATGVMPARNGH